MAKARVKTTENVYQINANGHLELTAGCLRWCRASSWCSNVQHGLTSSIAECDGAVGYCFTMVYVQKHTSKCVIIYHNIHHPWYSSYIMYDFHHFWKLSLFPAAPATKISAYQFI